MKPRRLIPLLSLTLLLPVAACDDDDPLGPDLEQDFTAEMTGAKEQPNPVSPAGTGSATFTLNDAGTTLDYTITVQDMTSTITASHIHLGNANVAGSVVIGLTTPVNGSTVTGSITSSTPLALGLSFESLLALMRNGDVYVNVHTQNNPAGEIRGQIEAES